MIARRGTRWARLLAALAVSAFFAVLLAGTASAHASMETSDPADGEVVTTAPATITITFNDPVGLAPQGNRLLDATGTPVEATVRSIDNTIVITPLSALSDGTYIVSWRVISPDSHPIGGGFSFSVGAPSAVVEAPAADAEANSPASIGAARTAADIVRYGGVLGFAGMLWFAVYAAPSSMRQSERFFRRMSRTTAVFGWAAAIGAIALVPLTKLWQDGYSWTKLASTSLWRSAATESPAVAAAVLAAGACVAAWGARRRADPVTAIGLLLALGSLVVVGHTRVFGPSWLVISADVLHVATAALWFGGLIGLLLLLLPDKSLATDGIAVAVGRFSSAALWLVVGLGATAIVLWWRIAGSFAGLFTSEYGALVLIKAGIVLAVMIAAAWNRYRLVPSIVAATSNGAGPGERADTGTGASLSRLRRSVSVEVAALVLVVAATGILTTQSPPSHAAPHADHDMSMGGGSGAEGGMTGAMHDMALMGSRDHPIIAETDGVTATITFDRVARGRSQVEVALQGSDGNAVIAYESPELAVTLPGHDLGPFHYPLQPAGPGTYTAEANFPLGGLWRLSLTVRTSEFKSSTLAAAVQIP